MSGSGSKTVKIWDVESGDLLCTMSGHTDRVKTVAVFPDGKRVVSASDDNFVKIWDVASSTCLCTLYGHRYSVTGSCCVPG